VRTSIIPPIFKLDFGGSGSVDSAGDSMQETLLRRDLLLLEYYY